MHQFIEIKNPCHENWNDMKLNNDGRFCLKCSQTVIDFTNKKPDEITVLLKNHVNENPCGKFNVWDVKTTNRFDTVLWKLNIKGFRYLALALVAVLFVTGCKTTKHRKGKFRSNPSKFRSYPPNF